MLICLVYLSVVRVFGWLVFLARSGALAGVIDLPAAPAPAPDTPGDTEETTVSNADLQIRTGDAPIPVTSGQPCPPGIAPIRLSAAETGLIERWKAGRLSPGQLAFHLGWSDWRRRHQARARWHHYSTRLAALAA